MSYTGVVIGEIERLLIHLTDGRLRDLEDIDALLALQEANERRS